MESLFRTRFVLIAFAFIFCINAFYILDTFEVFSKGLVPIDTLKVIDEKSSFLYSLNIAFFIILTILTNVYYWLRGRTLFFFVTILYIVASVAAFYYLQEQRFIFKKASGLWKGEFSITYFIGGIQVVMFSILLFIDYYIIRIFRLKKVKKEVAPGNPKATV